MAIPAKTSWSVRDLKEYVCKSRHFPVEDQNWIVGGTLPTDNSLLISILEEIQPGRAKIPLPSARIYRTILYITPFNKERILPLSAPASAYNMSHIAQSVPPFAGAPTLHVYVHPCIVYSLSYSYTSVSYSSSPY